MNLLALRERVRHEVAVHPTGDLAKLLRTIEGRLQALEEVEQPPTLGRRQQIAGECLQPAVKPTPCIDLVAAGEARPRRRSTPIAQGS